MPRPTSLSRRSITLPGLSVCALLAALCAPADARAQAPIPGDAAAVAAGAPDAPDATPGLDEHMIVMQMRGDLGKSWLTPPTATAIRAAGAAQAMLTARGITIDRKQALLIVDRAAGVQRLYVAIADPDPHAWVILGAVKVSTGKPGRKDHYKTPVGAFQLNGDVLGYRALGTKNENGVRGIGVKGMRVWDFGWQTTQDWRTPGKITAIRMEMHATDPQLLEYRLGRPDSEGCIRIPSAFNRALDHIGLIDRAFIDGAADGPAHSIADAALLPRDRVSSPLAGNTVVVFDSSEPDAPISDPALAEKIQTDYAAFLARQPGGDNAPATTVTGGQTDDSAPPGQPADPQPATPQQATPRQAPPQHAAPAVPVAAARPQVLVARAHPFAHVPEAASALSRRMPTPLPPPVPDPDDARGATAAPTR